MDNSLSPDEAEFVFDAASSIASYYVDLDVLVEMLTKTDAKLQRKDSLSLKNTFFLKKAAEDSIKIVDIYKHPIESSDPDLSGTILSFDPSLNFDPFDKVDDGVLIQFKSDLRAISMELTNELSNPEDLPQIPELASLKHAIDNFQSHSYEDLTQSVQLISQMPESQKQKVYLLMNRQKNLHYAYRKSQILNIDQAAALKTFENQIRELQRQKNFQNTLITQAEISTEICRSDLLHNITQYEKIISEKESKIRQTEKDLTDAKIELTKIENEYDETQKTNLDLKKLVEAHEISVNHFKGENLDFAEILDESRKSFEKKISILTLEKEENNSELRNLVSEKSKLESRVNLCGESSFKQLADNWEQLLLEKKFHDVDRKRLEDCQTKSREFSAQLQNLNQNVDQKLEQIQAKSKQNLQNCTKTNLELSAVLQEADSERNDYLERLKISEAELENCNSRLGQKLLPGKERGSAMLMFEKLIAAILLFATWPIYLRDPDCRFWDLLSENFGLNLPKNGWLRMNRRWTAELTGNIVALLWWCFLATLIWKLSSKNVKNDEVIPKQSQVQTSSGSELQLKIPFYRKLWDRLDIFQLDDFLKELSKKIAYKRKNKAAKEASLKKLFFGRGGSFERLCPVVDYGEITSNDFLVFSAIHSFKISSYLYEYTYDYQLSRKDKIGKLKLKIEIVLDKLIQRSAPLIFVLMISSVSVPTDTNRAAAYGPTIFQQTTETLVYPQRLVEELKSKAVELPTQELKVENVIKNRVYRATSRRAKSKIKRKSKLVKYSDFIKQFKSDDSMFSDEITENQSNIKIQPIKIYESNNN
jgi:hypothetical protein